MSLKNPTEMSLEELNAERRPLRQQIKRMGRCGRRTPELQRMKSRNIQLKDELERRCHVPPRALVPNEPAVGSVESLETGDIINFHPAASLPASDHEELFLKVSNR